MTVSVSNIIVIGYGLIGPRHAQAVHLCPHTTLAGIVESSPDDARRVQASADFPCTRVYDSLASCLEEIHVDGAVVCTPNRTHYAVTKQLLQSGINVIVEKPISPSAIEAEHLKQLARDHEVQLLVGHHRRFNPYVLSTKKHLHRVGDVIAVDAVWCLKKCDEYFHQADWRQSRETGGGVLNINLVHDLDLLQYFLGPLSEVYATEVKRTRGDSVEEGAVIHLTFANGTRGSFIVCDNVVSPANFEMGTGENPLIQKNAKGVDGVFYRFFGTRGTLSIPDLTLFHQDKSRQGWWEPLISDVLDEELEGVPFMLQMEHFARCIQGECEPLCTADDGIMAMRAVNAVIESLESKLPVQV